MSHPLTRINANILKSIFWILFGLTIGLMIIMSLVGAPLTTASAPRGIVSFEFAGSLESAAMIVRSWDEAVRILAAFSIGLDFLFLVLYSTTIGLACLWSGGILAERKWSLAALGEPLAWGQWFAALLDIVENIALMVMLVTFVQAGYIHELVPRITQIVAGIKFTLVFLGLTYTFLGMTINIVGKLSRSSRET